MIKPDYHGGSIVNLMASIAHAMGADAQGYAATPLLSLGPLSRAKNILLLVIDGLGYQFLKEHGDGSFLSGKLRGRMTSVTPSATATAIPAFMLGVPPQQHGFSGWFTYFRELGDMLAVLPFRSRHGSASLGTMGLSPSDLCGCEPIFKRMQANCSAIMPDWIAGSDFNTAFNDDAAVLPYRGLDDFFTAIGSRLAGIERNYVYAYWPEFDAIAHKYGVESAQAVNHFEQFDAALEQFSRRLSGSDTAMLVTSDHGFINTAPEHTIQMSDHPDLAECLVLPLSGESRFSYCYLRSGYESLFTDYVSQQLGHCIELKSSSEMMDEGWFGLGDPHPRFKDRIGDYILAMKGDYKIKDRVLGEHPHLHLGVHGGVSAEEMYVPLVAAEL
ncbi:alkaline phosphatase family protein [Solemya velesiana gill symbiont]|uniref:alkaline phosphatase family protein n=1 Tax=Solemya velesiana gill symbiont TaxID=1918948 RepID=UPI000998879B|nr:alkaline phosphatase family protein [Solemya velesiana gill symbiont]